MAIRNIRGRIAYLNPARQESGREWFSITVYPDGSRTARCQCHFDDVSLVRDVTLTLRPDFRPVDAYLRINHLGTPQGAGWFRFASDAVRLGERSLGFREPTLEILFGGRYFAVLLRRGMLRFLERFLRSREAGLKIDPRRRE